MTTKLYRVAAGDGILRIYTVNDNGQYYWRRGFPPEPGWYPASLEGSEPCKEDLLHLRYWSGVFWSFEVAVDTEYTLGEITMLGNMRTRHAAAVLWALPWWVDSDYQTFAIR